MDTQNRRRRNRSESQAWDTGKIYGMNTNQTYPVAPGWQEEPPRAESPVRAVLDLLVLILSLAGLVLIGFLLLPQLTGNPWTKADSYAFVNGELVKYDRKAVAEFRRYAAYLDRDSIFPGVFADGVHLGDMKTDEAEELLTGGSLSLKDPYSVSVIIGDRIWKVDGTNVPAERNLGNVLEKAWSYGRRLSADSGVSPYQERIQSVLELRENGVNLQTGNVFDKAALRKVVDEIAAYIDREPVDSEIASFDFRTRKFTFTESSPGVTIDADELYDKLAAELNRWEHGKTVSMTPTVVEPKVSKETLSANFCLISAYTTTTTKDSNRNTNIDLASQAVNGTVLMPGELFSFNGKTGERTAAKGYREAGAIAKGQSVEEIGGGVCQVSSTLFNAVARADLEIVTRNPHAWPSSYVAMGEDATVDWPSLDFKFRNNTESPIFVIMYYKDRKVSAEIWGMTLGEGVKIDLESKTVRTLAAPTEIKYEYNASLAWGESKTTVKARNGYVVETYQVWYQNGKEWKRELLHTSTYKAYQQVVEYNGPEY